MIGSLARRAVTVSAVAALGALGGLAVQAPAHASDFSASYTCDIPPSGSQDVTITGSLTAAPTRRPQEQRPTSPCTSPT
jgi:hypothetical protein